MRTTQSSIFSSRDQSTPPPTLSVVVPVYNAIDDLKECLTALAASSYRDFDVLVVDDGSTELVSPTVWLFGFDYMRIEGPGGPARARNRGVLEATGPYVVFVDADVCVHEDTLARFAERLTADPTIAAIVGCYDSSPARPNFLSQYKNLFHRYVHQSSDGMISTFWSGCGAMRRDLFNQYGGFDEQQYQRPAIEDIELGTRLSAAGHRIVLDSRIQGKHLKQWRLGNLLKTDIFDRGIPWTRLMWRTGSTVNTLNVKSNQRLSVVLVYLSVLFIAIGFWWWTGWLIAALLAASVTVINYDFYRFFTKHSGLWFTARVIPMHWLYFLCCGFCVA